MGNFIAYLMFLHINSLTAIVLLSHTEKILGLWDCRGESIMHPETPVSTCFFWEVLSFTCDNEMTFIVAMTIIQLIIGQFNYILNELCNTFIMMEEHMQFLNIT